ncbi:MAG: prolyl oligopeptidase family serine peptidase [Muribaculaceae bacterium]|nr:prolyl oligopeptidase family serine peptidase [Muribaculaceae bacterium]
MKRIAIMSALALMASQADARNFLDIPYPTAPADGTTDTYFGLTVADPYRPLEDETAAATQLWVEQERALTTAYLMQIPYRQTIKERLTELNNYHKHGLPALENDGKYYVFENDGLRNQSVLYRMDKPGGEMEEFLDPNSLSEDGTVALTGVYMSPSGKYTAYTISRSGSDWTEIYVMETATRRLLDDHIVWAKFTGASWLGDEGFYYSAYPAPEQQDKAFSTVNDGHRVYFHKIGQPQASDAIAYDSPDPLYFVQAEVSEDGSALFVYESGQGPESSLKVKDLRHPGADWQVIEPSMEFEAYPIDVIDGTIYMRTTIDAPLGRVVAIPLNKAADRKGWKTVVKEQGDILTSVNLAADKMLLTYDKDAANRVYVHNMKGKRLREISLPTYGVVGISSSKKTPEVYYSFASFTYPSTQYRYNVNTNATELYQTSDIKGFNQDDYVTEQVFYPSADGTKIPMFITYKKGLQRDGKNPVYLYGYGGFNITLNPGFSANRILWLENGGIYAQANLRGGNEYGEPWHLQGTKLNKLNVFADFIAAAEYMINEGWTTKDLMTIEGGSNGGLLVGACVNLRPDLFKVAIPRVGVMDMMRYHLFTIGWNWATDYGTSADSEEMARYLAAYSPAHNISNDGTPYPAILVTTADHDDRVVPAHSYKYAAALQAANTGSAPKIIRIDSKAGHGAGKPVAKVIDEYADIYSFIFYNLGYKCVK